MPRQPTIQVEQSDKNFERISWGTNFLMISFAIIVDLTQVVLDLIPFIGWLLSSLLAGFAYFFLWFVWKLNGVKFWERLGGKYGSKLLLRFGGSALLEATISFVPGLTILVITTNSLLRSEDKLVQEGVISREELDRIGELIVERDVQSAKELLELAREETQKNARRRVRQATTHVPQKIVNGGIKQTQNNKISIPAQNYNKYQQEGISKTGKDTL